MTMRSLSVAVGVLAASSALVLAMTPGDAARAASASTASPGKALFVRCIACHAPSAGAPRKIGPHLAGIVGRKAGAVEDFRYSPAMKKTDLVWDREELDAFLKRPASVVPGTSMAFGGMNDAKQRADLIDYLETLN